MIDTQDKNTQLGIILMVLTMFIFAVQDSLSRHLAAEYNVYMVVMVRYWFFAVFALSIARLKYGSIRKVAKTEQPFLQIGRGVLLVAEICLLVTVFTIIGLSQGLAIFIAYPLLVAAFSGLLLGETVGWRRWLAILVGFIGVLLIIKPGLGVFQPAALLALCSATMFAVYTLMTRYAARKDSAMTSFFWTGIAGAGAITCVGIFHWEPLAQPDWGWMGLLCLTGIFAHYLLIRVYELAEAGSVQPFAYTHFVFGAFLGYFIFGESIDLWTIIGAGIIIAAGVFTILREARLKGQ